MTNRRRPLLQLIIATLYALAMVWGSAPGQAGSALSSGLSGEARIELPDGSIMAICASEPGTKDPSADRHAPGTPHDHSDCKSCVLVGAQTLIPAMFQFPAPIGHRLNDELPLQTSASPEQWQTPAPARGPPLIA